MAINRYETTKVYTDSALEHMVVEAIAETENLMCCLNEPMWKLALVIANHKRLATVANNRFERITYKTTITII